MKALILDQFGDADQFKLKEIEQPVPKKGEVLIQVKAIGVNPIDTKVRNGSNGIAKKMTLPAVIGWDVSGTVVACGEETTRYKEGDEVFGCIGFPGPGGGYAEYAVAKEEDLAGKPKALSFEEAAAIPIVGLTAFQAIHEHLKIQKDDKLLLQAAAGGVGHLALQFAKLSGAYVIATASKKNHAFLTELGADQVIDYHSEKFEDHAKDVDAALDAMGSEVLYRSIKCVQKGGKVVCLPSSTKNDPGAIALAKQADVTLDWIIMHIDTQQLTQIAHWIAEGKVKINIADTFSFEDMTQAHKAVETHATRGKNIVRGPK